MPSLFCIDQFVIIIGYRLFAVSVRVIKNSALKQECKRISSLIALRPAPFIVPVSSSLLPWLPITCTTASLDLPVSGNSPCTSNCTGNTDFAFAMYSSSTHGTSRRGISLRHKSTGVNCGFRRSDSALLGVVEEGAGEEEADWSVGYTACLVDLDPNFFPEAIFSRNDWSEAAFKQNN